jgi:hypothetical protein
MYCGAPTMCGGCVHTGTTLHQPSNRSCDQGASILLQEALMWTSISCGLLKLLPQLL